MQSLPTVLPYIQIVLSVLLVGLILLQRPAADGSALGSVENPGQYQKRGLELTVFRATIVIALLFVASALLTLFY